MTGLQSTDLRALVAVRKRIDSLDRQSAEQRARRSALIRSLRESGMTLDQIAAHVGVTRQAVHRWGQD